MNFDTIWQLLLQNGASTKKEEGTRRFWDTLTPEQQQVAFANISTKLQEGRFVHFDPLQAIKENIRTYQHPQPTFLRGDEPDAEVQVRYNGAYKICSRKTMQEFGLEFFRNW